MVEHPFEARGGESSILSRGTDEYKSTFCYSSIMELYLNPEDQKTRRIAFIHCEDGNCGFLVEFKHPNCTFFFCKEHKKGFNLDLNTVPAAGAECQLHGKMERYDLLRDDNVCPSCESWPLAVASVGR